MKKQAIAIFQIFCLVLPWYFRRPLLNLITGVNISRTARVGMSIVLARKVVLEEGAIIGHFNFVNEIDSLYFERFAKLGRSNWVTGANSSSRMFSASERKCELFIGEHARVTASHYIDCTGGVLIGAYSTIAGTRTQILTHSIDVRVSKQVCNPAVVGKYCFVGTGSILLMGSVLPDYSVLGAGSVLNKAFSEECAVYAGNPARICKKLDRENTKYFRRAQGHVD